MALICLKRSNNLFVLVLSTNFRYNLEINFFMNINSLPESKICEAKNSELGRERNAEIFKSYRKVFSGNFENALISEPKKNVEEMDISEVSFFSVNRGVDRELHQLFFEISSYNLNDQKKIEEKVMYDARLNRFKEIVDGLSEDEKQAFKETYNTLNKLEKRRSMRVKIGNVVSKKNDPKYKKVLDSWSDRTKVLEDKFSKGEISADEYFFELDKINKEMVKDVGDDELNKLWEDYQKAEVQSYDDLIEAKPVIIKNDQPVVGKNEVTEAFQNVGQNGMDINFTGGGYATVTIDREFPVEISVYRNSDSQEIVYYVADSYAENGIVRVEANQLMPELDRRHMDAFLSKKIGKKLFEDYESVGKIPDKDLILMAEKLLGPGDKRFYKIVGDDRRIMEALVTMLVAPDGKFPNLYKKIRALNKFFEVKENVEHTRRQFLKGVVFSVSGLVNV